MTIIGNLVRDPETKAMNDGKTVCNFTVACNRKQKDQNGNSIADFFRVAAWGKLGENCQKYLAKGRKVAVVGSVSVHPYTDSEGNAKANLEVFAEDIEFLSPVGQQGQQEQTATTAAAPASAPAPAAYTEVSTDDLPF